MKLDIVSVSGFDSEFGVENGEILGEFTAKLDTSGTGEKFAVAC